MNVEEVIQRYTRVLTIVFGSMWFSVVFFTLLFELELIPSGVLVGDDITLYVTQTIGVLLTLAVIPGSLKWFHVRLQKLRKLPPKEALDGYLSASSMRIAALELSALYNLILYYFSLNTAPVYLTLITMMATVFCLPGRNRMREELRLGQSVDSIEEEK